MGSLQISYLVLVGPTCVGKTAYSHMILEQFPFEIINVDSFQVFKFFSLGTGRADLRTDRAHLYGFQDPRVVLSTTDYLIMVDTAIRTIAANGRVPFFEGGSISYLKALMSRYELELIGLRPRDISHAKELIERRLTTDLEDLLICEIEEGVKLGYENTIILQDDVVYLPYVNYLNGKSSLAKARQRSRENLLRRYETQMTEYRHLPVQWFEPSEKSLKAVRDIAGRFFSQAIQSL